MHLAFVFFFFLGLQVFFFLITWSSDDKRASLERAAGDACLQTFSVYFNITRQSNPAEIFTKEQTRVLALRRC